MPCYSDKAQPNSSKEKLKTIIVTTETPCLVESKIVFTLEMMEGLLFMSLHRDPTVHVEYLSPALWSPTVNLILSLSRYPCSAFLRCHPDRVQEGLRYLYAPSALARSTSIPLQYAVNILAAKSSNIYLQTSGLQKKQSPKSVHTNGTREM